MDFELQRLLDAAAVREVQLRYCRAVDRLDFSLMRSCFYDDAVFDHPLRQPCGVDEWINWCQGLQDYESTFSFSGNQNVDIQGNVAWAEQYLLAFHRLPASEAGPATDWIANCRYIDRLEKRGREWRIVDRRYVLDAERTDPVAAAFVVPLLDRRSVRNKADPSYIRG